MWMAEFLRDRWSSTMIAAHGEIIEAVALPALIAENHRGLASYRRLGCDAELVTLDAAPVGEGTGTALIEALAARLRADGCRQLWLTTTNDKLSALQFYLRRGFRLIQVRIGAVNIARQLKPSIPTVGEHGIPIHDELDLCRIRQHGPAIGGMLGFGGFGGWPLDKTPCKLRFCVPIGRRLGRLMSCRTIPRRCVRGGIYILRGPVNGRGGSTEG
jgi:hypothetical protein